MNISLPSQVKYIIDKIYENGYEGFIVGGCVRDSILLKKPNDYDITTNAKPQRIKEIFKEFKLIENGIKHGTVGVIINNEVYEITTYRIEGEYENNRHPKNVEFTNQLVEDLKRRDFTINAMAYNDKVGLIDEFDGMIDIENKIIRTVGNPDERFEEDGLRIIRAIRFSSKLNFEIEENTMKSIYSKHKILQNISIERITDEINKIIKSDNPQKIMLLYYTGVFDIIGMNLLIKDKFIEEKIKIVKTIKTLEEKIALIEYILDTEQNINNIVGYKNLTQVLRYSNQIIKDVKEIKSYMDVDLTNIDKIEIKKQLRIGNLEKIKQSLNIKKIYNNEYKEDLYKENIYIEKCISTIDEIVSSKECYKLSQLDINGKDLIKHGYKGDKIGEKLEEILMYVIENPQNNQKENLLKLL